MTDDDKPTPTPEAVELMASVAADVDKLAANAEEMVDIWRRFAVALRAGDYDLACELVESSAKIGSKGHALAHMASARFNAMEHVDPTLYKYSERQAKLRSMERVIKGWDVERLQHELEKHEASCDELGCPASEVLRDAIGRAGAH